MYLRLFFYAQTDVRESELLRAHVGQCATCRAIVAELDDRSPPQSTMSDRSAAPEQWIDASAESTVILPPGEASAEVERPRDEHRNTLHDAALAELPQEEGSTDTTIIVTAREAAAKVAEAGAYQQTMADETGSSAHRLLTSGDTAEFVLAKDGNSSSAPFQATLQWPPESPIIDDSLRVF